MTASPQQVAQWINSAHAANASGDFEAAANWCRRALKVASDIPEAWYNLGIALRGLGRRSQAIDALGKARALTAGVAEAQNAIGLELLELDALDEARTCFVQAIALAPGHVYAHTNLGNLLARMERFEEAEAALRQALALQPDLAPAWVNLGGVLNRRRQYPAAEEACRKAIAIDAQSAQAWNNLGSALVGRKQFAEAASAFSKAVELSPDLREAWGNLGSALCSLERYAEAESTCREALSAGVDTAEVWSNLAGALVGLKHYLQGEAAARRAAELDPGMAVAWNNLAGALIGLNQYPQAEAAARKSVGLDPDSAVAWSNLASALVEQFRLGEAATACLRAMQADPGLSLAHSVRARVHLERGELREGIAEFEAALRIAPDNQTELSRKLFWMNYLPGIATEDMLAAAREYDRAVHIDVVASAAWQCSFEPQRRLRIGLLSGDFRRHPVGYLLRGPLRHIDKSAFELHAYSNHGLEDHVTAELRELCEGWTNVTAMDDEQLADRIRQDRIDILLDLNGHTEHGRLPLFVRKPAPLQASWLGYFATTGVREIDWRIGDPWMTPAAEAGHFTEKIWRLPDCGFCFAPPTDAPPASPPPAQSNGYITYACFNNLAKMNDEVVALWSRILREDGSARLMLKSRQLASEDMRQSVLDRYAAQGIGPERVQLEPVGTYLDYLQAHARVDMALDPFPFTGGATTADALWMGVPVLTLKGDRYVAHQGESMLHALGLTEWIAPDRDDYVRMALSFAADRPAMTDLRSRLRAQAAASPLFDAQRYARNLQACWRGMWVELCGSRSE